jgi:hypothetical protein
MGMSEMLLENEKNSLKIRIAGHIRGGWGRGPDRYPAKPPRQCALLARRACILIIGPKKGY